MALFPGSIMILDTSFPHSCLQINVILLHPDFDRLLVGSPKATDPDVAQKTGTVSYCGTSLNCQHIAVTRLAGMYFLKKICKQVIVFLVILYFFLISKQRKSFDHPPGGIHLFFTVLKFCIIHTFFC